MAMSRSVSRLSKKVMDSLPLLLEEKEYSAILRELDLDRESAASRLPVEENRPWRSSTRMNSRKPISQGLEAKELAPLMSGLKYLRENHLSKRSPVGDGCKSDLSKSAHFPLCQSPCEN
jgi:hypothetical protein